MSDHAASTAPVMAGRLESVPLRSLLGAAQQLYENERFEDAAALFRYVLAFRSRSLSVWICLARCHEQLDDFETAARIYEAGQLSRGGLGVAQREALQKLSAAAQQRALRRDQLELVARRGPRP